MNEKDREEMKSSIQEEIQTTIPQKKKKRLRGNKIQIINYNPEKKLNLIIYYKLPGDIFIPERNLCLQSYNFMEDVKNIKKILSIEHDKQYNLVSCNLISIPGYVPPLELLVCRLQSLGDQAAYNLSKTVESIITIMKHSKNEGKNRIPLQRILEKPSYNLFLQSSYELFKKLGEKFAIIIYRQSNFNDFNDHSAFQISYNDKMIQLLGNSVTSFIRRLQKQGLPECVWMDKEYFSTMHQLIRLFFFSETENFSPKLQIKRDGEFLDHKLQVIALKFEEDFYRETFYIQIIEVNDNTLFLNKSVFDEKKEMQSLSVSQRSRNYSLLVERNNFMEDTLKWIRVSYPNINILMIESEEIKNNFRCGYRDVDLKQEKF